MKTQLLTSKPGWFILTFCFVFHMAYSQNAPLFNAGADPKPNGKKWALVTALSDEFNGGSLNKNKWDANPEFIFKGQNRGWYGSQRSLFEEDNATVTNGQLRIENEKFPSPRYSPKDDRSKPAVRKYGGAYVHGKTLAKPGYYMEARMRAANTAMSAAFWLKTEPIPCADLPIGENLELDIQECVGIMTGELGDNWTKDDWAVNAQWDRIFHYNTHRHTQCFNGSQQTKGGKINHGLNRNAFHVYGAYWRAGGNRIDFYHNGKLVRSVTPPIPFQGEMRLIMSSNFYDWIEEIGAGAMGFNNSKADRSVKFDWVRTWRLVDSGGNNASGSVFHITNRATDDRIRTDGTATDGLLEHVTNAWAGAPTKWTTINTSGGYFYLRNEENGMYFRPKDDSNGSPIVQVPSSYTGAYTQWRKVTSSNGYFYLQNKATGMYMRPEEDVNYSRIIQRPASSTGNWTQWKFDNASSARVTDADEVVNAQPELLGVNELNTIAVYPNPVSNGTLNIGLTGNTTPATISISNLSGQEIMVRSTNQSGLSISTESLATGIYLLKITTIHGTELRKIAVK